MRIAHLSGAPWFTSPGKVGRAPSAARLEEALQRHRTEARRLWSRIRPGIASPLALAEAVEDCFRGDRLPRAELLLGSRDRLVQALEIGVVERIAFLVVEAPKQ